MPVLKAEKISDDPDGLSAVYKVTAVVENTGFLSTYVSKKALERRFLKPLTLEIELGEGVELVSGEKKRELGHLEGRSNKMGISPFQMGYSSDYRVKAEWVVKANNGAYVEITARSERGGKVRKQVAV
jgi:hypothetical protein